MNADALTTPPLTSKTVLSPRLDNDQVQTQVYPEMSMAASKPKKQSWADDDFAWVSGADVFTPRDLVGLPRPGSGAPNQSGDLVLIAVSVYDFEAKK